MSGGISEEPADGRIGVPKPLALDQAVFVWLVLQISKILAHLTGVFHEPFSPSSQAVTLIDHIGSETSLCGFWLPLIDRYADWMCKKSCFWIIEVTSCGTSAEGTPALVLGPTKMLNGADVKRSREAGP
jgi:hypothetical protein